jgi:arginine/ornithine transport system substrate-binding protein
MKDFTRAQVAEATAGKKVGVQRATIHDRFISEEGGKGVNVKRYATQDEAYMDLVAGRVDMLLADSVAINEGFLKKPEGQPFQFIGPDLSEKKYFGEGAGIACRKQDKDLVELFNKAIEQIRADGTYKAIQDKYFNFNVYGE